MDDRVDDLIRLAEEASRAWRALAPSAPSAPSPFSPPEKRKSVARWDKLLARVLSGQADANIPFDGLCGLLQRLGYQLDRIEGSHHIFVRPGQPEILNLQPAKDGKAKDYQVKRVRQVFVKYGQTHVR